MARAAGELSSARLGPARPGPALLPHRLPGGRKKGRQTRQEEERVPCSLLLLFVLLFALAASCCCCSSLARSRLGRRACLCHGDNEAGGCPPAFIFSLARSLAHLPAGVVVVVRPAEHRWRAENGFLGQQAARSASTSVRPLLLANSAGILAGSSAGCLPATIPSGERAGGGFSSL